MKKMNKIMGAVLMAGTFCLAGCKSNIEFNQEDLDKMIVSTNEYLENQNNYSTEFAYNYLIDTLIKGMDKLDDKYVSYKISGSSKQYDIFGNVIEDQNMIYQTYKNEETNTVISRIMIGGDEVYGELVFASEDDTFKYNVRLYDVGTKKYIEEVFETDDIYEDGDDAAESFKTVVNNSLSWYQSIYAMVATDHKATNVIMDKVDGQDVFTIMLNLDNEDEEYTYSSLKAFFKDGYLVKVELSSINSDAGFAGLTKDSYEFEYNTGKLEIANKSSYTKAQ